MESCKRTLTLLLAAVMVCGLLSGCGSTATVEPQNETNSIESLSPEISPEAAVETPDSQEVIDAEEPPAESAAPQPEETVSLDEMQKNSITMLNYITVLSKEISASKGSRVFLEQVYDSLLNNTYPSAVDEDTQEEIEDLLDTLENFRLVSVKRDRLKYIYDHNKAQALRNAIPNPVSILGMVASKNILKSAVSLLYTAVDSWTSYSAYTEENDLQYLQDGWELDDEEAETLHEMRRDTFSYMIDMVRQYNLPGDLALSESAVDNFVKWKDMTNTVSRISILETNEKTYEAFGSYWLVLAKSYFDQAEYGKCLDAINRYKQTNARIFRSDYEYAEVLPYAILAAKELYQGADYEALADQYASAILQNTDPDDWSAHYFVALTYLELCETSGNTAYLQKAYDITLNNVTHLVDDQKALNESWLAEVQTVTVNENDFKDKKELKEEKKKAKQYNDQLKAERKVALPPVSSPLRVNCELLFALAEKLGISPEEQNKIDAILHENGSRLFLTEPLDNSFSYAEIKGAEIETAKLEKGKLVLPAILVSEDSVIRMTMPDGSVIEDWKVSAVDRPNKNDVSTFETTYTSKDWSKAQLEDGQTFLIVIYSSEEAETPDCTFRFAAKQVGVGATWSPIKTLVFEME